MDACPLSLSCPRLVLGSVPVIIYNLNRVSGADYRANLRHLSLYLLV